MRHLEITSFVDLLRKQHRKNLLTEAELTFKKACEIAQVMEMADVRRNKTGYKCAKKATQGK